MKIKVISAISISVIIYIIYLFHYAKIKTYKVNNLMLPDLSKMNPSNDSLSEFDIETWLSYMNSKHENVSIGAYFNIGYGYNIKIDDRKKIKNDNLIINLHVNSYHDHLTITIHNNTSTFVFNLINGNWFIHDTNTIIKEGLIDNCSLQCKNKLEICLRFIMFITHTLVLNLEKVDNIHIIINEIFNIKESQYLLLQYNAWLGYLSSLCFSFTLLIGLFVILILI